MKPSLRPLLPLLAAVLLPLSLRGQKPPPFAVPPPAPPATASNATALQRTALAAALDRWKARDGGAAFSPSLSYLRDTPVLMLLTDWEETGPRSLQRKRAIVQACGFLLDDPASAQVVICVVGLHPRQPGQARVRNHAVPRPAFHAAAQRATGAPDRHEALRRARDDEAHSARICADLGVD